MYFKGVNQMARTKGAKDGKKGNAIDKKQFEKLDLILNRIRIDMGKRGDMMSVEDVTEILGVHLIGVIPDDEQIIIGSDNYD